MDEELPLKKPEDTPKPVEVSAEKLLDEKHNFYWLSQILLNDDFYNNILRVLVNKGDSILIKNDPVEEKDTK
jgi:hypothetical protein